MNTVKSQNWKSVGSNICTGIGNGINAGWSWLKTKVSNLAKSLLNAAKSALGIHSPSRLFRDQVGLNIGYGVGEGIEASEDSVLDSVCAVADAIADEFRYSEYRIDGVISNTEIESTLNGFADKIADSFAALMDRMQAIAESASFRVPNVSRGHIVPYTAQSKQALKTNHEATTPTTGQVLDSISDAVYSAVLAAMRQSAPNNNQNINVYLDGRQITAAVEKQQHERGASLMGKEVFSY